MWRFSPFLLFLISFLSPFLLPSGSHAASASAVRIWLSAASPSTLRLPRRLPKRPPAPAPHLAVKSTRRAMRATPSSGTTGAAASRSSSTTRAGSTSSAAAATAGTVPVRSVPFLLYKCQCEVSLPLPQSVLVHTGCSMHCPMRLPYTGFLIFGFLCVFQLSHSSSGGNSPRGSV